MLSRTRNGQVMLEMGLALFGLVTFFYVTLKSWLWMTSSIAERQVSFQQSRGPAGRVESAGTPVPYARPMLQLIDEANSVGGGPGEVENPEAPEPCVDRELLMQRAESTSQRADAAAGRAAAKQVELMAKQAEAKDLQQRLETLQQQDLEVRNRVAPIARQLAEIDAQLRNLDQAIPGWTGLMMQYGEMIDAANGALSNPIGGGLGGAIARIAELLQQRNAAAGQLDGLYAQSIELTDQIAATNREIQDIDAEMLDLKNQLNPPFNPDDYDIPPPLPEPPRPLDVVTAQRLRARIQTLLNDRLAKIEILQTQVQALADVTTQMDPLHARVAELDNALADADGGFDAFGAEVAQAIGAEIADISARIEALQAELSTLDPGNPDHAGLIAALSQEIARLEQRVNELSSAMNTLASALDGLGSARGERGALVGQRATAVAQRQTASASLMDLKTQLISNISQQRGLMAQFDPVQRELERLQGEYDTATGEANGLQGEAEALMQQALGACTKPGPGDNNGDNGGDNGRGPLPL